jgi:hypothetical protein
MFSRSRRSGLNRLVLERTPGTGAALQARHWDQAYGPQPNSKETTGAQDSDPTGRDDVSAHPTPAGALAQLNNDTHAPMHQCPATYSRGGGGGHNKSMHSSAKRSLGTTPQHNALQRMTQRMLHQIDRLAGRPQHLLFDPNTDQIHISTELRATCEQALLNTLCNWDQLPTLTPEQLKHRQAELAYYGQDAA